MNDKFEYKYNKYENVNHNKFLLGDEIDENNEFKSNESSDIDLDESNTPSSHDFSTDIERITPKTDYDDDTSTSTRRSTRLCNKKKSMYNEDDYDNIIKGDNDIIESNSDTKYQLIAIERILNDRVNSKGEHEYLVKYKDISYVHINWETEDYIVNNRRRWKYAIQKYEVLKSNIKNESDQYESESDLDISSTNTLNYKKYQCVDKILLHKVCMLEINKDLYLTGWRVLEAIEDDIARYLVKQTNSKQYYLSSEIFTSLIEEAKNNGMQGVIIKVDEYERNGNTKGDIPIHDGKDEYLADSLFLEETLYLVKWRGLDYDVATYERAVDIKDNQKIQEYYAYNNVPDYIKKSNISDLVTEIKTLSKSEEKDSTYQPYNEDDDYDNNKNNYVDHRQIIVPPNLKGAWRKAVYECLTIYRIKQRDICENCKITQCALSTWLHSKYSSFPKSILPKLSYYMRSNYPEIFEKANKEYLLNPEEDKGYPIPIENNNNYNNTEIDKKENIFSCNSFSDKSLHTNSIPLSSNYQTSLFKNMNLINNTNTIKPSFSTNTLHTPLSTTVSSNYNNATSFLSKSYKDPILEENNKILINSNNNVKKPFIKYKESRVYKNNNKLRDYQIDGLNWLIDRWMNNINSILADEMGLGKTAQVICLLEHLYRYQELRGPFLIIVPLSTIKNWKREIENWTDFKICLYHGKSGKKSRDLIRYYEWFYPYFRRDVVKFDILLTTYDILITDLNEIVKIHWKFLVLDEAHRLRNRKAKTFVTLQLVTYDYVLLLTGTPFQNNVEELWSLLHFIKAVGSKEKFMTEFSNLQDYQQVENLQKKMENCLLRRIKEDVEKSIPEMVETIIDVELTILQKQYYRAIYDKNRTFLYRGCSKATVPSLINIEMELRKCCNHPFLIKGSRRREFKNEDLSLQEELSHLIDCSGKMVLIDKLLPKLRADNHKVLIFSQMVKMLDLLQEYCRGRNYQYERIDGGVKGDDRQLAIDRFCSSPHSFIFLLSTRAGGIGINLTAADTVIIYDSDWNPQNDCQATARCHRIGQTNEVKVYRLITRKTYEAEMFEKASMKLGLEQALFSGTEEGNGNRPKLSKTEMENLLRKGAYGCLQDDDKENKVFYQADIEEILKNNTREVKVSTGVKGTRFSKTTFVSETKDAKISVDDPRFWEKVLPDMLTPDHFKRVIEKKEGLDNEDRRIEFISDVCLLSEQYYSEKNSGGSFSDDDWNTLCYVLLTASSMIDVFTKKQCKLLDEKLRNLESLTFKRKRLVRAYEAFSSTENNVSNKVNKVLDPWDLPICYICERDGRLIQCRGRCQRVYHPECLGITKEQEEGWTCENCKKGEYECQICHKTGAINKYDPNGIVVCAQSLCNKFYHVPCIKSHPLTRLVHNKNRYFCPAHYCRKCNLTSADGELVQCFRCIKAYHVQCIDWKLAIRLKRKVIICSDHVTPEEVSEYNIAHKTKLNKFSYHSPCALDTLGGKIEKQNDTVIKKEKINKIDLNKKIKHELIDNDYYINDYSNIKCRICHIRGEEICNFIKHAFIFKDKRFFIHKECAESFSDVICDEPNYYNIISSLKKSKLFKCNICGESRASIMCNRRGCDKYFHYPCLIKNNIEYNSNNTFYCKSHATFSRNTPVKIEKEEEKLCICGIKGDSYSGSWIQCEICQIWFHIECVSLIKDDVKNIKNFYCPHCIKDLDIICNCIPYVKPMYMKEYIQCSKCMRLCHLKCIDNKPENLSNKWICELCNPIDKNTWKYRCSDCYYSGITSIDCRLKHHHISESWSFNINPFCCVCGQDNTYYQLIQCNICKMYIHEGCVGESINDPNNWKCNICKESKENILCEICGNSGGAMKKTETNNYCHIVCALWIDECTFSNVEHLEPVNGINKIAKWRYKCECSECPFNKKSPCIKCHYDGCNITFHPICGRKSNLYMIIQPNDDENIEMIAYCAKHSHITIGYCQICKRTDKADQILLCDRCGKEYHIYCLNPPLLKIPDGNWYCKQCQELVKIGNKATKEELESWGLKPFPNEFSPIKRKYEMINNNYSEEVIL